MRVRLLISRASWHSAATSSDPGAHSCLFREWRQRTVCSTQHSHSWLYAAVREARDWTQSCHTTTHLKPSVWSNGNELCWLFLWKSLSCSPLSAGLWPLSPQALIHVRHMARCVNNGASFLGPLWIWHRFLDILHTIAKRPYQWVPDSTRDTGPPRPHSHTTLQSRLQTN